MGRKYLPSTTHIEAFDYYYSLGKDRTLRQVAKKFGVAESTAMNWSSKYKWANIIFQRDTGYRKNNHITAVKLKRRILISNLMKLVSDKIESGEIAVNSVDDLVTLIRLDLLLMGEPVNITETSIVNLPIEIRTLLDDEIEKLTSKTK